METRIGGFKYQRVLLFLPDQAMVLIVYLMWGKKIQVQLFVPFLNL